MSLAWWLTGGYTHAPPTVPWGLIDHALRSPGRVVPTVHAPSPCELDAAGVKAARAMAGGGYIGCQRAGCDRVVYVPPA